MLLKPNRNVKKKKMSQVKLLLDLLKDVLFSRFKLVLEVKGSKDTAVFTLI